MPGRPRVLAVDDEINLLQLFEINLGHDGFDVTTATTPDAARAAFQQQEPDLVILDMYMGGEATGIELAQWLRARSTVPILFLTAAVSTEEALAGYGSGVDDFVRKPFPPAELTAKVRALLRRTGRDGMLRVGSVEIDAHGRTAQLDGEKLELTKTEFDILELLTRHAGRVVSKQQLLSDVWGSPHFTPNVVEVHVSSLRRKLEAASPEHQPIETVRGVGYVLRG